MATYRSDLRAGGLLFILLVLAMGPSCGPERSRGTESRPNVILITLDTLRADHLGCYGATDSETPSIDRLAAEGARFDQAISSVPLTLPSHSTMLTGLLPLHHGVRQNGAGSLPGNLPTLQGSFKSAGYRTGAFVGSFVLDRRFGLARDFDVYDDEIPRDPSRDVQLEAERPGSAVVDRASAWIGSADSRPSFMWVHLFDAHAPYNPPERFRDRFASDPYSGEVASVDFQVGRLLEALGPSAADALVVVAGDHGEALGEHGEMTHGLLLYEGTLRVPLILRGPGVASGRVIRTPVSLADLAPTILALANASPLGSRVDGRDLSESIREGREPVEHLVYSETEYPTLFGWSALSAIRGGSWKLIDGMRHELFDLATDPMEQNDRTENERRRYRSLSDSLGTIRSSAVEVTSTAIDEETRRKLESLGYVGAVGGSGAGGCDPRDCVGLFVDFEKANQLLGERRNAEAIATLQQLVRTDPSNAIFLGSLGRALRESGRLEEAIALYREAVAQRPEDAEAWYNLAVTYRDMGRLDEASVAIEESLRRNDENPEAHNVLGIVHSILGDNARAMEEFRRVVQLDPRSARGLNNLGNALREENRLEEAVEQYRAALEVAPDYADPCNGIGTIEVQRGRPGEAIAWFERALALAPDLFEARFNRAIALEMSGQREEAIDAYADYLARTASRADLAPQRAAAKSLLERLEGSVSPDRHN